MIKTISIIIFVAFAVVSLLISAAPTKDMIEAITNPIKGTVREVTIALKSSALAKDDKIKFSPGQSAQTSGDPEETIVTAPTTIGEFTFKTEGTDNIFVK